MLRGHDARWSTSLPASPSSTPPSLSLQCSLLPPLPKPKWLLSVYARDVLSRLPEVKAKITSVFGSVLKMDSTKKVKKIAQIILSVFILSLINCVGFS